MNFKELLTLFLEKGCEGVNFRLAHNRFYDFEIVIEAKAPVVSGSVFTIRFEEHFNDINELNEYLNEVVKILKKVDIIDDQDIVLAKMDIEEEGK